MSAPELGPWWASDHLNDGLGPYLEVDLPAAALVPSRAEAAAELAELRRAWAERRTAS